MRSVSFWFLALLLLPSLVLAKTWSPPRNTHEHGDFVTYSHNGEEHRGIVIGHGGHPLRVAPLAPHSPSPPGDVFVDSNQLHEMHPSHADPTGYSNVAVASDIARLHGMRRRRVYDSLIV
ncbi:hypothetical protein JOM56_010394 [Amanita muscaria]